MSSSFLGDLPTGPEDKALEAKDREHEAEDKDQELKDIDQEAEDQTAPRANSMARDRGSSEDWETESEVRAAQCETGIEMLELCDRA